MNKQQIKAELRRSACEDNDCWNCVSVDVFEYLQERWNGFNVLFGNDLRTFFLLVAEAL